MGLIDDMLWTDQMRVSADRWLKARPAPWADPGETARAFLFANPSNRIDVMFPNSVIAAYSQLAEAHSVELAVALIGFDYDDISAARHEMRNLRGTQGTIVLEVDLHNGWEPTYDIPLQEAVNEYMRYMERQSMGRFNDPLTVPYL